MKQKKNSQMEMLQERSISKLSNLAMGKDEQKNTQGAGPGIAFSIVWDGEESCVNLAAFFIAAPCFVSP